MDKNLLLVVRGTCHCVECIGWVLVGFTWHPTVCQHWMFNNALANLFSLLLYIDRLCFERFAFTTCTHVEINMCLYIVPGNHCNGHGSGFLSCRTILDGRTIVHDWYMFGAVVLVLLGCFSHHGSKPIDVSKEWGVAQLDVMEDDSDEGDDGSDEEENKEENKRIY